ncbi:unnamed protein product, partial [Polarella glacialis]
MKSLVAATLVAAVAAAAFEGNTNNHNNNNHNSAATSSSRGPGSRKVWKLPKEAFVAARLAPDELSCTSRGVWRDFRVLLGSVVRFPASEVRSSGAVWHGCSGRTTAVLGQGGTSPATLAKLFRRAVELSDFFRETALQVARQGMSLVIAEGQPPAPSLCLFGYVNALAAVMRVALDRRAGRCGAAEIAALEAEAAESELAAHWLDAEATEQTTEAALYLQVLLTHAYVPLLLLDSSPWPFGLANVSQVISEALGEPRLGAWRAPSGGGWWRFRHSEAMLSSQRGAFLARRRAMASAGEELPAKVKVWSLGLHATLAMEPETLWLNYLPALAPFQVTVESVLAQNYCNAVGRCTTNTAIADLLNRHVVKSAIAMNGINKFPHVPDPLGLQREFLAVARADEGIREADVLMCSEPPFFCLLFLELDKPIFGYFGNPFGAYLEPGGPQETFYQAFREKLAADPRNAFACMSPYLSALVYWHSGIRLPIVQPLGLYTKATYRPSLGHVLVTKTIFVQADLVYVLNEFVEALAREEAGARIPLKQWQSNHTRFVHLKQLKDSSWQNWARHKAAVMLPYDPQLMTFYELYSMAVPLLVPDEGLLPLFTRLGYTNLQEFEYRSPGWSAPESELAYQWTENAQLHELRWWSSLSDMGGSQTPHLLRWGSVPELLWKLLGSDLDAVAAKMRRETELRLVRSTDFWCGAFLRALQPQGGWPGGPIRVEVEPELRRT